LSAKPLLLFSNTSNFGTKLRRIKKQKKQKFPIERKEIIVDFYSCCKFFKYPNSVGIVPVR